MNREAWLERACELLRPLLAEANIEAPTKLRLSVGFPGGGSPRKRIGECWAAKTASDGVNNIFISPVMQKPNDVLATLVHELIHAADDCKSGHKGAFARMAKNAGLTGKMTATVAGPELTERLTAIAGELGEYPHGAIALTDGPVKKQSTRMLKVECELSGYTVRTTKKWLDEYGTPICPCCGAAMTQEQKDDV